MPQALMKYAGNKKKKSLFVEKKKVKKQCAFVLKGRSEVYFKTFFS